MKVRLPIGKHLLHVILDRVQTIYDSQPYLESLFRTIFITTYYGLLRVGGLTQSKHCLRAVDMHSAQNKDKIQIVLRSSKMHRRGGNPQVIKICGMSEKEKGCILSIQGDSQFCWHILWWLCEWKRTIFIFSDGRPVPARHVCNILRLVISMIGLEPYLYDTHSFHIVWASDLMWMGVAVDKIKAVSRWKSNLVYQYFKT